MQSKKKRACVNVPGTLTNVILPYERFPLASACKSGQTSLTDGYGTPTPPPDNLQLCFGLVLAAEKDMVNEFVVIMTGPTQMNLRHPSPHLFFRNVFLCLQAPFVSRCFFLLPAVL